MVSTAQQSVDVLPVAHVADYTVREAILQPLNLSPEVYRRRLREIEFGPEYHPRLTGLQSWAASVRWLQLALCLAKQIVKAVMVEHYMAILPLKPKHWVLCHQPFTLEKVIVLMDA